jgi:hypothetical protein
MQCNFLSIYEVFGKHPFGACELKAAIYDNDQPNRVILGPRLSVKCSHRSLDLPDQCNVYAPKIFKGTPGKQYAIFIDLFVPVNNSGHVVIDDEVIKFNKGFNFLGWVYFEKNFEFLHQ